jgi:hypothetical protein
MMRAERRGRFIIYYLLFIICYLIQPDGDDFETRSCSLQPKLHFPLYFAQEFWQEIHDLMCVCVLCVCMCVLFVFVCVSMVSARANQLPTAN